MEELSKDYKPTLRELRMSRKMTQAEVAEKSNISIQRYSRIEKNYKNTTITTLEKILDVLNYSITVFFK